MSSRGHATQSEEPVAGSPGLRRFVLWISARCLRWVYREQRLLHADRIPVRGPVLLIGNHPNDLPDVLLGYGTTSRPVRYLATVSAATSWLSRKTYQWLGVIPVARIRDARKMQAAGVDVVALNRAATEAVAAAFAAGEVVGAFPEGGVRDLPTLADFRTGVASMVLKYLDAAPENDVCIVPFGLQYEAGQTVGSDVITVVGEPLSARSWLRTVPAEQRGAAALTRQLRAMVMAVTRNAADWEQAVRRDEVVAAVAAQLAPRDPLSIAPSIARHAEERLARVEALPAAAAHLARAVQRAGGIGTSAVDHAQLLVALDVQSAPAPLPTLVLWMGVPAAALGWFLHGPVFAVIAMLARRQATARTDRVAYMYVPGVYLVALWYLLVLAGLVALCRSVGLSPWWCVPVALFLPRFGDLAVGWRAWLRHWQLVRAAHRWSTPERAALREAAATVRRAWESAASTPARTTAAAAGAATLVTGD